MQDQSFTIRVNRALFDRFKAAAAGNDESVSGAIRELMLLYIAATVGEDEISTLAIVRNILKTGYATRQEAAE